MNNFANRILAISLDGWQAEVDATLRSISVKFKPADVDERRITYQIHGEIELDVQDLDNLARLIKKHDLRFRMSSNKSTWIFFE